MHLIRAATGVRGLPQDLKKDRKPISPPRAGGAPRRRTAELDAFVEVVDGAKYPHAVATWRAAWERFTPLLAFPPGLCRVIHTTNSIESLAYQLRKVG